MINLEKIVIVGDKILIKSDENINKSHGGLYLPPGVTEKEKVQSGYVIKVGPGYPVASSVDDDEPWKENKDTKYLPLQAKEGDYAIFLRKEAIEIEMDREKFVIVPQVAILLLLRDDDLLKM